MSARYEYRRSVTHRCGHRQIHTLHARYRREADLWADNLKRVLCDACKAKADKIAAEAKAANLPALAGSPNQITWANAIRQHIFNILSRTDRFSEAAACCRYEVRASWWIDNRNTATSEIIAHLTSRERRVA